MIRRFTASLLAIAVIAVSAATASATLFDLPLDGNDSTQKWTDLSGGTLHFGSYPGTANWPSPVAAQSGAGTASLNKVANNGGNTSGPYPSSTGIYFGGTSTTSNVYGGTLAVSESAPVTNLQTVVLQVDIQEALGYDFYNGAAPRLYLNGSEVALDATYTLKLQEVPSGTYTPPGETEAQPLYRNTWLFQWDLSGYSSISSFSIEFDGVEHAYLYSLQLDQTDAAYGAAVVPEPSTWSLLALVGFGSAILVCRKRRLATA